MPTSKMTSPRTTDVEEQPATPARESLQTTLFRDHQRLDRLFRSIVYAAEGADPAELRGAWMAFDHELERHLEVEETQILPSFAQSRPREARVLKAEHDRIRARLMDIGVALDLHCLGRDGIDAFGEELRAHARHEDALFYPWAHQHLDPAPRAAVTEAVSADHRAQSGHAGERWWIDADRSTLEFSLRHIVVGQIRGRFARWGGTLRLDVADVRRSTVRVWVDLASIDTGDGERDQQVRSSEFFDVARFPRAVFSGTQVQLPEGGSPVIAGVLDLHGIKADVELEITDDLPWAEPTATRMSFPVNGRFDRRRFGLRWNQDLDIGGVVVGDHVDVTARLELVRAGAAVAAGPRRG